MDDWNISNSGVSSNDLSIRFSSSEALEIVTEITENSKYYLHTENIFVIKVLCSVASTIVTEIEIVSD